MSRLPARYYIHTCYGRICFSAGQPRLRLGYVHLVAHTDTAGQPRFGCPPFRLPAPPRRGLLAANGSERGGAAGGFVLCFSCVRSSSFLSLLSRMENDLYKSNQSRPPSPTLQFLSLFRVCYRSTLPHTRGGVAVELFYHEKMIFFEMLPPAPRKGQSQSELPQRGALDALDWARLNSAFLLLNSRVSFVGNEGI